MRQGEINNALTIPAIWTVQRGGHCACLDSELGQALDGLLHWIETGHIDVSDLDKGKN
jgi:hypothetical protein